MIYNFNYSSVSINRNNNSINLRITQTPQAIRNNYYNEYVGKFSIQPQVAENPLKNQKISLTFISGRETFYSI